MVGYLNRPEATAKVAQGRLVQHGRPRLPRRRRVPEDHRPAQPVLEDRRRDGAAHGGRVGDPGGRRDDRAVRGRDRRCPTRSAASGSASSTRPSWARRPRRSSAGSRPSELPRLWIPSAEDFIRVEAIPILGTGKVDLRRLKEIAAGAARRRAGLDRPTYEGELTVPRRRRQTLASRSDDRRSPVPRIPESPAPDRVQWLRTVRPRRHGASR